MEVELHQLSLRYEHIRRRDPREERAILASMAEIGQQLPIVVVSEADHHVLIDGYKRVRALKRMGRDTARVTCWQICEAEALLLERTLRSSREDALEQAWLLAEMQERFALSLEELARRFGHRKSWVSERLALIQALPQSIQEQVRCGTLSAHAAMKYLVPWARADRQSVEKLCTAIGTFKPTSRQMGALYQGWQDGTMRTRELILASPEVFLNAKATTTEPPSAAQRFLQDLGALGGIAQRAYRTLQRGLVRELLESERQEVTAAFSRANADWQRLLQRMALESGHAG